METTKNNLSSFSPPSVNFHLTKYCNMRCSFCFATFYDLGTVKHDYERSSQIIREFAKEGFEKLTFAGGEPTLVNELPDLAALAKQLGLVTTIVTNGSRLADQDYFNRLIPHLDWVAISIDSIDDAKNLDSGRAVNGKKAQNAEFYKKLLRKLNAAGVKTKINTVVSAFNYEEDLTNFINSCKPRRWKILQALPVEGQNSSHKGEFEVTIEQFEAFLKRHSGISPETTLAPEGIELIKGSYIMVSPDGKFYDNTTDGYKYSEEILKVGIKQALKQINFDQEKFLRRGGLYSW